MLNSKLGLSWSNSLIISARCKMLGCKGFVGSNFVVKSFGNNIMLINSRRCCQYGK
jgi:hypothetical protein